MDGWVDQIVNAAITQTGGIEDIIKTIVGQVTQEIRRENTTFRTDLNDAHHKIEWLEGLIKHEEQDKFRALQAQRAHYLEIGGPAFQRTVHEHELQKAKDVDEITFLEAQHLGDRSQGSGYGHGWYNQHHRSQSSQCTAQVRTNDAFPMSQAPTSANTRSSATMKPHLRPSGQHGSKFPVTRPRSATTMNPDAQPFTPSPVFTAGAKKPPIDSLAIAPAPRVHGLRNPHNGRYDSPVYCPKCRKHFAFLTWNPDHFKDCKGPDTTADISPGRHSVAKLPASYAIEDWLKTSTTERPDHANDHLPRSDLPLRAATHSSKSSGTSEH